MVLLQFGIVLLRYVFGVSYRLAERERALLHAPLFMLGAGYTLLVDEHVRVDIFYAEGTPRRQALIDIVGHCSC